MLDSRYQGRPTAIQRKKRPDSWAVDIVKHSGMPPDVCALYIELVDLPPTFEINQRYVVNTDRYGGEKRVRRMFKDMIDAGRMRERTLREPDGKFKRGIYEISDEPKWLSTRLAEPVDNFLRPDDFEIAQDALSAEGKNLERRAADRRPGIRNSIVNPDTDTGRDDVEKPVTPRLDADGRHRGRKAHVTREAERRVGGAKVRLPEKEPRNGAAKGSPGKGFASGEAEQTPKDRNIERMRERMFAAAGPAMANPRKAARLMSSLIQWKAQGFDFDRDVLPVIADVSHRPTKPPGSIISWDYFSGAIRDRHGGNAAPAPSSRQLEGWTPVGAAFTRRR
jgi:hypothetical protein